MAPYDPQDLQPWHDLARQWEHLGATWLGWWQQAANLPGLPPGVGLPPVVPAGAVDAEALAALNARFQPRFQALAQRRSRRRRPGARCPNSSPPPASDRRFRSAAWREQPYFAFLKQAYLLYAEYVRELASLAPLPGTDKRRLEFATRQYLDAIAPIQFSGDQPGRAREGGRDRRREPRAGPSQPGRRCAKGPHHDDRREGVRGRQEPGDDARQRRIPQRADRADPVRRRRRPPCTSGRWSSFRRASTSTTSST